jgi:undecaprenyl-diphosphatase
MNLDERLFVILRGDRASPFAAVMVAATVLGSGWTSLGLLPLLALRRSRRFALMLAGGFVTTALAVVLVKAAVGRVRPWQALGLAPLFDAPTDPSFPSGHAAGAFACALFVTTLLVARPPWSGRGRVLLVSAAFVLAAAAIALSRVYLGVHYPADVACGALLGGVFGHVWARAYLRARQRV